MVGTASGTKGRNPMNSNNIKGWKVAINRIERGVKTQRVEKKRNLTKENKKLRSKEKQKREVERDTTEIEACISRSTLLSPQHSHSPWPTNKTQNHLGLLPNTNNFHSKNLHWDYPCWGLAPFLDLFLLNGLAQDWGKTRPSLLHYWTSCNLVCVGSPNFIGFVLVLYVML